MEEKSAQLFCHKLMMMDGALHSHTGTAECMCWLKFGADVLVKMILLINMNGLPTSERMKMCDCICPLVSTSAAHMNT